MSDGLDFHFLRPWWLLAVPVGAALVWFLYRTRRGANRWRDVIDPELLPHLVLSDDAGPSNVLVRSWPYAMALAGWLAAALALAGPTWERLPQPVEQRQDALVVLLDLSLSMYAEDVAPSRIARARHEISDLLRLRSEGYTGLIAYAGDAHVVVPLTDDVRTINNLLPSLEPAIMPVPGSQVGPAITLANELMQNANMEQGRLLLITDEVVNLADVAQSVDTHFPLSVLGVGSERGGRIPLNFSQQPGRYLRDAEGVEVVARLDVDRLAEAARIGGGGYRTADAGDGDVAALLGASTPWPALQATERVAGTFDTWLDRGYLLALLLIPLTWLAFRRGVVAVLLLALLPAPRAEAFSWADLWQTADQQGQSALNNGQPDRAATLFQSPQWRASALYRSERYADAAETFRRGAGSDAQYNLGNALAKAGDFPNALKAYDRALASAPDHDDARFNKALIEQLMQQQQAADSEDSGSEQRPGGERSPEQPSPQRDADGEQQDSGDEQQDASQGMPQDDAEPSQQRAEPDETESGAVNPEQDAEDPAEQERRRANEQWLRRVPDDPGGLLRRKFQQQSRDRYMSGERPGRDVERIW